MMHGQAEIKLTDTSPDIGKRVQKLDRILIRYLNEYCSDDIRQKVRRRDSNYSCPYVTTY